MVRFEKFKSWHTQESKLYIPIDNAHRYLCARAAMGFSMVSKLCCNNHWWYVRLAVSSSEFVGWGWYIFTNITFTNHLLTSLIIHDVMMLNCLPWNIYLCLTADWCGNLYIASHAVAPLWVNSAGNFLPGLYVWFTCFSLNVSVVINWSFAQYCPCWIWIKDTSYPPFIIMCSKYLRASSILQILSCMIWSSIIWCLTYTP